MLGIDRRTLKIVWTVFLFALIALTVYHIRRTLMIFVLALFFSHLLAPIIGFFERMFATKVPRVVILVLVYIVMVGVIVFAIISVGSRIGEEAASLALRLPDIVKQDLPSKVPLPSWLEFARPTMTSVIEDRLTDLQAHVLPILSSATVQILTGIGNIISAILIPILSFFFLKDGAVIRKGIVESFPPARQPIINDIFVDLHLLLAQYIRALVLLSLLTFVVYSGFLSMVGVSYSVLLAGTAAILEFIPVVGPLTASVVILLVAGFTGFPHWLWILIFLVIYRIFQDYAVNPYLMSSGVEVHPLLVLLGVLAGEQIAGIPGMFFSVPVIAALRVLYVRLRRHRRHAVA